MELDGLGSSVQAPEDMPPRECSRSHAYPASDVIDGAETNALGDASALGTRLVTDGGAAAGP